MMVINKNGIIKVPLVKKDVGCVRVSNITTIPAFSLEQIPVRITNIIKDKEVIVKPTNIINKHNLLLPRCIISNNKQESYIKIFNPSDQPVTLKRCIVIGTCCPVGNKVITQCVSEVNKIANDIEIKSSNNNKRQHNSKINFNLSQSKSKPEQRQKLEFFFTEK